MTLKPCVVFDLDGTLADTSGDLVAAANHCFRGLGLGDLLCAKADAATALRGGRAMLTLGFARAGFQRAGEIDRQYTHLLKAYGKNTSEHSQFYAGALAAVQALRQKGYAVAICTNKPERLAHKLLTELKALHYFDALIGADTLPVAKPDPKPFWAAVACAGGDNSQAVMIGDTKTDQETAQRAGVPFIATHFADTSEAETLSYAARFTDYADLGVLIADLLPLNSLRP